MPSSHRYQRVVSLAKFKKKKQTRIPRCASSPISTHRIGYYFSRSNIYLPLMVSYNVCFNRTNFPQFRFACMCASCHVPEHRSHRTLRCLHASFSFFIRCYCVHLPRFAISETSSLWHRVMNTFASSSFSAKKNISYLEQTKTNASDLN